MGIESPRAATRLARSVGRAGLRIGTVLAVALALAALPASIAGGKSGGPALTRVKLTLGGPLLSVPPSYVGIAVEYNDLLRYERHFDTFARLLSVLRPPGEHHPVVMRLGGESSDSSFWESDNSTIVAPRYRQGHPYSLTPAWMDHLGAIAKSAGLQLILDLNLAAHSPRMAAQVAAAAKRQLPSRSVIGFEVGNEPDLYTRGFVGLTRVKRHGRGSWARRFTIPKYISLFGAYVRAIRRAFPGAPMVGPSTTSGDPGWISGLVASHQAKNLSLITAHEYPLLNGCAVPGQRRYPSATKYLKEPLVQGAARLARHVVADAGAGGLRLRMTEVGSSFCTGIPGQSDTFATALWAPDQLFTLMSAGVSGVNVEVQTYHPNSSLNYTNGSIIPEPMFYGLALVARTLGPGARLMRVAEQGDTQTLKVWAVRLGDGTLHVLYINKTNRNASVTLGAPSSVSGAARLERLTAPGIYSNETVTLAGQRLGPDGSWQGRLVTKEIAERGLSYQVRVPAFSSALLAVPAPGGR